MFVTDRQWSQRNSDWQRSEHVVQQARSDGRWLCAVLRYAEDIADCYHTLVL